MMRFKYNSNYTFEERVELVSKEIIDEYPEISINDSKKIASLDSPIDDKVTLDEKFMRYYLILLVIKKDNIAYKKVFADALALYNEGLNDEKLNNLMIELFRYNNNERPDFPIISEFYK